MNNSNIANNALTLKFEQVGEQETGHIRRVSGLTKVRNLIPLITAVDLEANPRSARVGPVTDAIGEALETTPDTFPFKTKGILVGASAYEKRDRMRYSLTFANPEIEGILDGGHNTLAIGLYILGLALGKDAPALKKAKRWLEFKELWADAHDSVVAYRESLTSADKELETLVPVELLLPLDPNDDIIVTDFNESLLDICAARNNNVQLKAETKANQSGYFDELKGVLPKEIAKVEWKTNDGGIVKSADVIALLWIALAKLPQLPLDDDGRQVEAPVPQNIYRSKGDCVNRFERLMSSTEVTSANTGQYKRELHNPAIWSAIKIGAQIPVLYDRIYAEFPDLYNQNDGKFGRISVVKKMDASKGKKISKFTQRIVKTRYPDGFIVPLVYGLQALLEITPQGLVQWKTDPDKFLDENLAAIVKQYKIIMAPWGYDPQKIGKDLGSYTQAVNAFETEFLKSQQSGK